MPAAPERAASSARLRSPRPVSCGVLVTDGRRLLIGHATRSIRWDIPKGVAEMGEAAEDAARRELAEETGLDAADATFDALGNPPLSARERIFVCFAWQVAEMPDIALLRCRSTFLANGRPLPEFDRFDCPPWAGALPLVAASMQTVLAPIATARGWL